MRPYAVFGFWAVIIAAVLLHAFGLEDLAELAGNIAFFILCGAVLWRPIARFIGPFIVPRGQTRVPLRTMLIKRPIRCADSVSAQAETNARTDF